MRQLARQGWICLPPENIGPADLERRCVAVARSLGVLLRAGRGSRWVDFLEPKEKSLAAPRSLSAQTGTGQQPWHVDFAHLTKPARYIVLGCVSVGAEQAPTELLARTAFMTQAQQVRARSEPFLIRNGSRSFYGCILDGSADYLRFDPGCMEGVTTGAQELIQELSGVQQPATYEHRWSAGGVLVIDNWHILHRRADAGRSIGRVLLRVTVGE